MTKEREREDWINMLMNEHDLSVPADNSLEINGLTSFDASTRGKVRPPIFSPETPPVEPPKALLMPRLESTRCVAGITMVTLLKL